MVSLGKKTIMKTKAIPDDVKQEVKKIVEKLNRRFSGRDDCYYVPRFQGRFLYLDRSDYGSIGPICRLTYTGRMDKWKFAIFKWSTEEYDPEAGLFPGRDNVNGTVEGAMKAGLEAYPP
jgi:hypothetical protein